MSQTYYEQSNHRPPTMTVRQLIAQLAALPDEDAPVIFKSPEFGCYGPETAYAIDSVVVRSLEREVRTYPGGVRYDDETGEEEHYGPFEDVRHAWTGVVIG